jgi:hypothetical protein
MSPRKTCDICCFNWGIDTLPLEFFSAAVCEQLRSAETIAVHKALWKCCSQCV